MIHTIRDTIYAIKQSKPLVLCLTNYVTMDFMANSLLAVGASPLMSVCDEELEELILICHTVMINIGTLDEASISRYQKAAVLAKHLKKPLILDPVGSGASHIRTQTSRELMEYSTIIRGNASEINALTDDHGKTQGVDSLLATEQAKASAQQLAKTWKNTIVISGAEDFVVNDQQSRSLHFGSPIMPLITGMGCTLTAIIAAFQAVISDPFEAAHQATAYFGICGDVTHQKTNQPGTFRTLFIDELYRGLNDDHQQGQSSC